MQPILLVPASPVGHPLDPGMMKSLAGNLSTLLHSPVHVDPHHLDTAKSFEIGRNQYNSTAILMLLQKRAAAFGGKVLAVTNVDLFVPVLTYVFGEAQLDGPAAVVSTYRLDETLYGYPPNRALFDERLLKEAMHELGHTFGLYHCHNFGCAMHSSTAVEEIDLKGDRFCSRCEDLVMNEVRSA